MNRSRTFKNPLGRRSGAGSKASRDVMSNARAAATGDSTPRTAHARRLRRERIASYVVGALFVVTGLSLGAWALWPYVAPIQGPRLVFDEQAFDFGTIDQTNESRHVFTLTNRGNETLRIKDVVSS